jgi:hypothetical protein
VRAFLKRLDEQARRDPLVRKVLQQAHTPAADGRPGGAGGGGGDGPQRPDCSWNEFSTTCERVVTAGVYPMVFAVHPKAAVRDAIVRDSLICLATGLTEAQMLDMYIPIQPQWILPLWDDVAGCLVSMDAAVSPTDKLVCLKNAARGISIALAAAKAAERLDRCHSSGNDVCSAEYPLDRASLGSIREQVSAALKAGPRLPFWSDHLTGSTLLCGSADEREPPGVLFKSAGSTEAMGADDFLPGLIFALLRCPVAFPYISSTESPGWCRLQSNIRYISDYAPPSVAIGEGGYFLTSLTSAVSFLVQTAYKRRWGGIEPPHHNTLSGGIVEKTAKDMLMSWDAVLDDLGIPRPPPMDAALTAVLDASASLLEVLREFPDSHIGQSDLIVL